MLANETAHIFAVAAGFRAKTRMVRCHLHWQLRIIKNLTGVDVGDRHFCRWNKIKVALVGELKQIGFKLRQLSRTVQGLTVHHERGKYFGIAVLLSMEVKTEVNQCAFQARADASKERETCPGDFRRSFEVKNT